MRRASIDLVLKIAAVGALSALLSACGGPRFVPIHPIPNPPEVQISELELRWSNVYLLRSGTSAALVDCGSPGDWDALVRALRRAGLTPRDLRIAVMTHGHGDHAGVAAHLRAEGVPVALGRGDMPMAARGRNDPLRATGLSGTLLRPIIDFRFTPWAPSIVVDAPLTLADYGLPDVRVEPLPGHTPGSLVVWAGPRDVLAGDVMLGGILGGTFFGGSAGEHYYQTDRHRNYCNVQRLLDEGAQRFYVGHGGPIGRDSVLDWRRGWAREVEHCERAAGS